MNDYSLDDVVRSYNWLGHANRGFTEVNAIAPQGSARRRTIIDYMTSAAGIVQFVERNAEDSLLLVGLNPRPKICAKDNSRLRSATNDDITVVRNLMLDVDLHGDPTTGAS